MSTYLLVDKLVQDWTEMWCDKQQLFPDVTVAVAILHVMSCIDFTNMKTI